jgi:hypothetical protein
VPWRDEIEDGIASCSKFVALVDSAWLTSYNCLQELALAFNHGKPVVCIVLSQEAWELLTIPGGAEAAIAKAQQHLLKLPSSSSFSGSEPSIPESSLPSGLQQSSSFPRSKSNCSTGSQSHAGPHLQLSVLRRGLSLQSSLKAWSSQQHGAPLFLYKGQEIVPGQPLSQKVVQDLFMRLSSINLCPARELDETVKGLDGMLETVGKYVQKDLDYHKVKPAAAGGVHYYFIGFVKP